MVLLLYPFVTIIIPCKDIDHYTKECIEECRQLDYPLYEILLLPDKASSVDGDIRIISTGSITPGAKRNIGISHSHGEICAFLDSDSFPRKDWLINAMKYFEDPHVSAVGGPGLTPRQDEFMQQASGIILSSSLVGTLSKI